MNKHSNHWMIDAEHLSFHHDSDAFDFSCRIKKGEAIAILGENGAGKSTFLNLIAGFLTPDSGVLFLDGQNCTDLPASKRPIAFIFQENNLFAHLTVEQNLRLALASSLHLKKDQHAKILKLANEMNLNHLLSQKAETLSGGQKQRAALARALLQDRPILLLDEPFSALDKDSKTELFDLLFYYQKQKQFTLLMVTHHLDDLVYFEQNTMLIKSGTINSKVNHINDVKSY